MRTYFIIVGTISAVLLFLMGFFMLLPFGLASASGFSDNFDSYSTAYLDAQTGWDCGDTTADSCSTNYRNLINNTQYVSSPKSVTGSGTNIRVYARRDATGGITSFSFDIRDNATGYGSLYLSDTNKYSQTKYVQFQALGGNYLRAIPSWTGTPVNISAYTADTWVSVSCTYSSGSLTCNGVTIFTGQSSNWSYLDTVIIESYNYSTSSTWLDNLVVSTTPPPPSAPTVPVSAWNAKGHEAIFDVTCNTTGELWDDFGGTFTKYSDCTSGVATEVSLYSEELSETPVTVNFQTRNGDGNSVSSPYSVTFAPYDPPTVPADYEAVPDPIEFDVTCNEAGDLYWYVWDDNEVPPEIYISSRILKADCEVNEDVPVTVIVSDVGDWRLGFFQSVGDDETEVSEITVTLGYDFVVYNEPILVEPSVVPANFTDENVNITFLSAYSGTIECTNLTTDKVFSSSAFILDLEHQIDLNVSLDEGENEFICYNVGDWGRSSALEFSLFLLDEEALNIPVIQSAEGYISAPVYRVNIDVPLGNTDDLYCKVGAGSYILQEDLWNEIRYYWDLTMSDVGDITKITGFSFLVSCYLDDLDDTVVSRVFSYRPRALSNDDSVFCSSLNHANDEFTEEGIFIGMYRKAERTFINMPIIGDLAFLSCFGWNNLLKPIWSAPVGLPVVPILDSFDFPFMGEVVPISIPVSGTYETIQGIIDETEDWDKFQGFLTAAIWLFFLWRMWTSFGSLLGHSESIVHVDDGWQANPNPLHYKGISKSPFTKSKVH